MRRLVAIAVGVAALAALTSARIAGAAGGEVPVTVPIPSTEMEINAGFSPRALPRNERTPIRLTATGEISDPTGGHPPALRELSTEFDRAISFHLEGVPACKRTRLGKTTETATALKACRSALIGEGEVTVQVSMPEQNPVNLRSKLLIFKGGERGGKTTLFMHAYFSLAPLSGAVVIPVTIARHANRRFGTRAVARIPQLAGGWGSLTKFNFEIFGNVEVGGDRYHPISATCADGELRVFNRGTFEDGDRAETELVRACTAKG
ncbi:MAG TPA: hypothetical protein VHZ54_05485 [Solirubrobacterales bacterium]|nr:hypothetical protein [Solirubrobacterales bacterium]